MNYTEPHIWPHSFMLHGFIFLFPLILFYFTFPIVFVPMTDGPISLLFPPFLSSFDEKEPALPLFSLHLPYMLPSHLHLLICVLQRHFHWLLPVMSLPLTFTTPLCLMLPTTKFHSSHHHVFPLGTLLTPDPPISSPYLPAHDNMAAPMTYSNLDSSSPYRRQNRTLLAHQPFLHYNEFEPNLVQQSSGVARALEVPVYSLIMVQNKKKTKFCFDFLDSKS